MIQDVIQYLDDDEDEEGIIVFMDQQKTFDGVEWDWVDCVLNISYVSDKFRGWVQNPYCSKTGLNQNISKCHDLYNKDA